jgi:tRNA threonylcarbamoyladenosine biosynthesis protein TsaE
MKLLSAHDVSEESHLAAVAAEVAAILRGGSSVGLVGQLGAGKTTFVRYLARSLGVQQGVSSPSYVLSHDYRGTSWQIEHWDLYRLQQLPLELWEPPNDTTVRLLEWSDKFPELLTTLHWQIEIEVGAVSGAGLSRVLRVCRVSAD